MPESLLKAIIWGCEMNLTKRSNLFLILAFAGVVFGTGQIWGLAMAVRDGTRVNIVAAVLGIAVFFPSTIVLSRILRFYIKGSGNQIR